MATFLAGFGRVDLTPKVGCQLVGYGNRTEGASGIHDPLSARALVLEALLTGGGLWLASWIGSGSLLGVALGIWTFFLVQSLFFVLGGVAERQGEEPAGDAFDAARARALRLMEQGV